MKLYSKYLLILFVLQSLNFVGQASKIDETKYINERRGQLFFRGEIDYRIWPVTPGAKAGVGFGTYRGTLDSGAQNSGTGINYSLNYFITKNFSFNFGQSFRYETLFYKLDTPNFDSTQQSEKALTIDYHFSVDYYIKLFNKGQLYFRLGLSYNNTNSEYYVTVKNQQTGTWISSAYDTAYSANNFGIGYKVKKIDLAIGVFETNQTEYQGGTQQSFFPYVKLSYDLFKF